MRGFPQLVLSGLFALFAQTLPLAAQASGNEAPPAQGTPIAISVDSAKVMLIFRNYCSGCHVWANTYQGIVDGIHVVPGDPDNSPALDYIEQGIMPADGRQLLDSEKKLIRDWIKAGAPQPPAAAQSEPSAGTDIAAQASQPVPGSKGFLGFPDQVGFHRVSGWTGGSLLLAAGLVGAVHAFDMMSLAHAYRDANGITEFGTLCPAEVAYVYGDPTQQALRWTHVGLLAAGETFYFANAFTGSEFMFGDRNPSTKALIHRYAFFAHLALMATEGVMGYFSSQALQQGDHETFSKLLVAHAAVGITIPVIILGAGAVITFK